MENQKNYADGAQVQYKSAIAIYRFIIITRGRITYNCSSMEDLFVRSFRSFFEIIFLERYPNCD